MALPANRSYTVEHSKDIVTWQPIHIGTSTGAAIDITDETADARCFYRLRVVVP